MNRILTLAAMCVASAMLSVLLVPRDAQARREVTLFGKVEGEAPSGTAKLAFNFYDPDTNELVYRTVANARVEDGAYSAEVPAEELDGEYYLMSVTAPEILPLGVQGPDPIANVRLQTTTPGTQQVGHANISGTLIAGAFIGDGSGLTNVHAVTADNATTATNATNAVNATNATNAVSATMATNATNAGNADLLDGLDSLAFLTAVPNPLSLTNANAVAVVTGTTSSTDGTGIFGTASSATGATKGVHGSAVSTSGWAGYFEGRGYFSSSLGIGTSAPASTLHMHGNGTELAMRMTLNGVTNPFIFTYKNETQQPLILSTGAQERFSFLANGRFGVGTVAPVSALHVIGNAAISGNISKGSGTFLIDHPLNPQNEYLYHSFVESPDMMNVYNGVVRLDARGEAVVALPRYFETLNKDYRYQLTPIGGWAPVYVASKVRDNSFAIAGGKAGMEVSWQVTGVRQDPYANANRVIPEVEKPDWAKGTYLYPSVYGEPESRREDVVYGNMLKRGKK